MVFFRLFLFPTNYNYYRMTTKYIAVGTKQRQSDYITRYRLYSIETLDRIRLEKLYMRTREVIVVEQMKSARIFYEKQK
jgi:hypothetical protein